MQRRPTALALAFLGACIAACSSGTPVAPPGTAFRDLDHRVPRAAATPSLYFYAANYGSNDVAQYGFIPSTHAVVRLAANYALPGGCGPVDIALVPKILRAFVSCYGGSVIPLIVTKQRTLASSSVAPVALPSPLALIAPTTGTANRLYAALYSTNNSPTNPKGGIAELSYTAKSLTVLKVYSGGYYPGEMAFYTGSTGVSQLFVSAPFDLSTCAASSSKGAIEVWTQAANGSLTAQPSIPICAWFWNLAVAGNALFAAGPDFLKGFSLPARKPMKVPAPVWAAKGKGPTSYPQPYLYNISALFIQPTPPAQRGRATAEVSFATANSNATLTIFNGAGQVRVTIQLPSGVASLGRCILLSPPITIDDVEYNHLWLSIVGDDLVIGGTNDTASSLQAVTIAKVALGNEPQSVTAAAAAEFPPNQYR
ncbi:MAG: hypothetical protein JO199_08240 [Candidatus Eremiobacteraeota bacterium]|nr:hypothetical protein [Candidatus Eremiobacteraeota bacterium]